jgi:hypothetical protein
MAHRTLLSLSFAALLAFAGPAGAQRPTFQAEHTDACELGDLRSCSVLGLIYETGAGGVRDMGRALELYERACAREVEAACLRLALLEDQPPADPNADHFVRFGRVADAETGAPIPNALVELPGLGLRRTADPWGRVDLGRLPRGSHRISVRRGGYDEITGQLPVPWDSEFVLFMFPEVVDESPALGGVFGQVSDAATGAPIANVEVTLLAPNPVVTISNQDGRFAFGGVNPGRAEVRLSHIGYQERRQQLSVQGGRTVEVYASLSTRPIELEPIVVTIGSAYLDRSGFYRRARAGAGYVLTRRDFDGMNLIELSEVFARVPGVFVEQTRQGARVVTRREMGRDVPGACRLRPYLDGIPMTDWDVNQVRPDVIEGLEVHQGLAAPIEYRNLTDPDGTSPCGVVLIWTTRGGR